MKISLIDKANAVYYQRQIVSIDITELRTFDVVTSNLFTSKYVEFSVYLIITQKSTFSKTNNSSSTKKVWVMVTPGSADTF
jgi:hypothetical protein